MTRASLEDFEKHPRPPSPEAASLPFKRLLGLLGESDDLGKDLAGVQGHRLSGLGANQEAGLHHTNFYFKKITENCTVLEKFHKKLL